MQKKIYLSLIVIFSIILSIKSQPTGPKQGQARIDSLLVELKNDTLTNTELRVDSDTNGIKLLIALAYEYHRIDPDEGIKYAELAMKHSNSIVWKKGIASAGNRLGLCYWAKSDFPKSLEYHFAALKLSEETNEREINATILGNIGLVFADQLEYAKALEYHFKGMKMNTELGNKSGVARNLGNIGIVYDAQGEFTKALEYYEKALTIYEELSDKGGIARNLGNIGFVYQEQNNHVKALEYYFKALPMNEEIGNKILMAQNLGNIGETYFSIANDTFTEINLHSSYLNKKEIMGKSEIYLKKSISIFEEIEDYFSLQELYLYLSNLKALSGNYKESLQAYKQHIASRDSVYNESNNRRIHELEKNREEDLKQKEIEIKDLQLLKAKDQKRFMFAGLILFACLAGVIYNRFLIKQKSNIKLLQTLSELKNTQQQLVISERMAAFGVMASRVAHEIMNPLNFINNFSEMAEESVQEIISSSDVKENGETIKTVSSNLSKIIQHGKRAESIVNELLAHTRAGTAHEFFDNSK